MQMEVAMATQEKDQMCDLLLQKMISGESLDDAGKAHLVACEECMGQVVRPPLLLPALRPLLWIVYTECVPLWRPGRVLGSRRWQFARLIPIGRCGIGFKDHD
jgi:hypothetical protein